MIRALGRQDHLSSINLLRCEVNRLSGHGSWLIGAVMGFLSIPLMVLKEGGRGRIRIDGVRGLMLPLETTFPIITHLG